MERLLCIKIASRGDLLLAAPAFRHLREQRRGALITLLVGQSCLDVAEHLPFFDQVRAIDDRALMAGTFFEKMGGARAILSILKAERFDGVFIFHRDWRYALLAKMARIPVRAGFRRCLTPGLTHAWNARPEDHHVKQYLDMVSQVVPSPAQIPALHGIWQFKTGERENALAKAKSFGFDPIAGKWVALAFGGGRNVKTRTGLKTWPLAHFQELAARLVSRGWRVAWAGDREDAADLGEPPLGVHLAGKLSVSETAAILSVCTRVVANDSLLLHLGEAVSVPTVGLFGPTDPAHYRPLGAGSRHLWLGEQLECSPCHREGFFPVCRFDHACMRDLKPDVVLQAVEAA